MCAATQLLRPHSSCASTSEAQVFHLWHLGHSCGADRQMLHLLHLVCGTESLVLHLSYSGHVWTDCQVAVFASHCSWQALRVAVVAVGSHFGWQSLWSACGPIADGSVYGRQSLRLQVFVVGRRCGLQSLRLGDSHCDWQCLWLAVPANANACDWCSPLLADPATGSVCGRQRLLASVF